MELTEILTRIHPLPPESIDKIAGKVERVEMKKGAYWLKPTKFAEMYSLSQRNRACFLLRQRSRHNILDWRGRHGGIVDAELYKRQTWI